MSRMRIARKERRAISRYDYKPEYGKGDHLRKGADLQKYREGWDRIFGEPDPYENPEYCGYCEYECGRPLRLVNGQWSPRISVG